MAGPREAVGCRTLICRKVDSGQLNDRRLHAHVDCRNLWVYIVIDLP